MDLDGDGLPVDPDERGTADRGEHGDLLHEGSVNSPTIGPTSPRIGVAYGGSRRDRRVGCDTHEVVAAAGLTRMRGPYEDDGVEHLSRSLWGIAHAQPRFILMA